MGWAQRFKINGVMPGWQPVTRWFLQGSTLGPDLSNVFINDLNTGLKCILRKFSNYTKLVRADDSLERREALQGVLDKLEGWAIADFMKEQVLDSALRTEQPWIYICTD